MNYHIPHTFILVPIAYLLTISLSLSACSLFQTADSTPIVPIITTPPPEIAYETLAAVSQSVAPPRDMVALTAQLRGIIGPRVAQTEPTPYQLRQHVADLGGTAVAYFSASDEVVTAVNPYSNQREMLIISLDDAALGSDAYYATIAHEWQHAIQWHTDPNETA